MTANSVIRKVRIQDASAVRSLLGKDTVESARDMIRDGVFYSDQDMKALVKCTYKSEYSVVVKFISYGGDSFVDSLLKYLFFEKKVHKVSSVIPVYDNEAETVLKENGFLQEAVLHDELLEDGFFVDAGLFYITVPMYRNYNVGFIPFQRGVIAVSGGVDYVDGVSFLRFDSTPQDDYIRACADHSGLISDGKLRSRGDRCYEMYEATDLPAEVMRAVVQIKEYLAKKRTSFDIIVKTHETSEFSIAVWNEIKKIPYGYTKSYEDVALELTGGDLKEAHKLTRAVGHACSQNPVPIIVPCHRVIGKDGKLVGFKDGVEFKDFLLTHELFAAMPLV